MRNDTEFTLHLNPNFDQQVIDYISAQPSKSGYLRKLVENDMISRGIPISNERRLCRDIESMLHQITFSQMSIDDLESIWDFIREKMP